MLDTWKFKGVDLNLGARFPTLDQENSNSLRGTLACFRYLGGKVVREIVKERFF